MASTIDVTARSSKLYPVRLVYAGTVHVQARSREVAELAALVGSRAVFGPNESWKHKLDLECVPAGVTLAEISRLLQQAAPVDGTFHLERNPHGRVVPTSDCSVDGEQRAVVPVHPNEKLTHAIIPVHTQRGRWLVLEVEWEPSARVMDVLDRLRARLKSALRDDRLDQLLIRLRQDGIRVSVLRDVMVIDLSPKRVQKHETDKMDIPAAVGSGPAGV